ncbi:hypothetical protein Afil01_65680 [Actinorhabdospora filicis]|uniref:Putative membrane protein insertion efficiency factor n=1 Tax=Actinorhabdospora filicis TaxID=1785913 RepID=A0A9W6SW02_9ACTN|nr:membrane protein insertion efficiency factor YidD [Actinorhabdospora filicis]GLZ81761.1 hypothetical protein Afil01_65680 [Actinorhabdospora filicis]
MDCDLPDCAYLPDDCSGDCSTAGCGGSSSSKRKRPPHEEPQQDEGAVHRVMRAMALDVLPATARPLRPWSPRLLGVWAIRFYQRFLSPRLPYRCRFTPSCSRYGMAAVRTYGLWRGSRLAAGRILRCNGTVRRGTADPLRVPGEATAH